MITNNLQHESSPYLQQHADNPVHWHAWNDESLSTARNLNKPILLSIGYSACHWCHVMAHESFEDQATADIMNALFFNIKVDKEERPDLDKIYQNAHSLLTERAGGWPLTIFITPDTHMPIFAGTYFPKHESHGLPAFSSLLKHISEIWDTRKTDIDSQSSAIHSTYDKIYESSKPVETDFNRSVIDIARNQIEKQFDPVDGGFSEAPKFPHPSILEFILSYCHRIQQTGRKDPRILHSAIFTLDKMAEGGLFDHLGGGFCRYSTDKHWMIPHFEKMLYDNGPLLSLYSRVWKLNNNSLYHNAVVQTADWVMREMQSDDGGYFAAQDADSEGEEGKFFAWKASEIDEVLTLASNEHQISENTIDDFKQTYGLSSEPNFENQWHFHTYQSQSRLTNKEDTEREQLGHDFNKLRQAFFDYREQRVHPDTDDKVLTAWNGLMIHGMASAGRLLNNPEYTQSAARAAYYIKENGWLDKQLYASTKNNSAKLNAYLDDYAFLIYGLLELLQSQWDNTLYQWCLELADTLLSQFEDSSYGGFYFTSHQHESLIQRLKTFSDDAIPSGNAIAALSLNRLGYLSGRQHYIEATEKCLRSAWTSINHAPISHCAMLNTLEEFLSPPDIVILRTQLKDKEEWQRITQEFNLASTLIYTIPSAEDPHESLSLKAASDATVAYICQGMQCKPALSNPQSFREYLRNNSYRI